MRLRNSSRPWFDLSPINRRRWQNFRANKRGPAEFGLYISCENREIIIPLILDEERLVIGDEFGKQGQDEQRKKNPERPETALYQP